jgi:hypothetical protein
MKEEETDRQTETDRERQRERETIINYLNVDIVSSKL